MTLKLIAKEDCSFNANKKIKDKTPKEKGWAKRLEKISSSRKE